MRLLVRCGLCGVAGMLWTMPLGAAGQSPAQILPIVDHIHLNVPDQAKGVEWYQKFFAGKTTTEAPDRLMFDDTRLIFLKNDKGQPSSGSALDHIGFSVADLDAKMKEIIDHIGWRTNDLDAKASELKSQNVKFTTEPRPLRLAGGATVHFAYVEGPAGAKIELVQR